MATEKIFGAVRRPLQIWEQEEMLQHETDADFSDR